MWRAAMDEVPILGAVQSHSLQQTIRSKQSRLKVYEVVYRAVEPGLEGTGCRSLGHVVGLNQSIINCLSLVFSSRNGYAQPLPAYLYWDFNQCRGDSVERHTHTHAFYAIKSSGSIRR